MFRPEHKYFWGLRRLNKLIQLSHCSTSPIPLFIRTRKIKNVGLLGILKILGYSDVTLGIQSLETLWHSKDTWALRRLSTQGNWSTLFIKFLIAKLSCYTTLLSNSVGAIHKHLPPFVFLLQRHMAEVRERHRFSCPTPWFTPDLYSHRKCASGKVWEAEFVLHL